MPPRRRGTSLPELVTRYLEVLEAFARRRSTLYSKRSHLRRWVKVLPPWPTRADVERESARLVAEGRLSRRAANNSLVVLAQLYEWAQENGFPLECDPARRAPRFALEDERPKVIPPHVEAAADDAARAVGARSWALWRLCRYEGLRRGEVLALEAQDFDLRAGLVHVRGTRAAGSVERGDTKTRKGRRSLPLSPETLEALEPALIEWSATAADARGLAPRRYPLHHGVELLARLTAAIDAAAPGAFGTLEAHPSGRRVRRGSTFHRGRHSLAADLVAMPVGSDESPSARWLKLQAALGHEHLSSTATYAARLSGAERSEGAAALLRDAARIRAAREAARQSITKLPRAAVGAAPEKGTPGKFPGVSHLVPIRGGNKMGSDRDR